MENAGRRCAAGRRSHSANPELRMSGSACLLVLLLLWVHPAATQTAPASATKRLTIDDVLAWRIASSPAISPDGRRALFLIDENDFEKSEVVTQLWWVDTASKDTRRLTHTDGRLGTPRWSPDGQWISFLAARGSEPDAELAQVWLLSASGGEAFPLTEAPEGVLHYAWAPDSSAIYYLAPAPPPDAIRALRERRQEQKADHVVVDEERLRREFWRVVIEGQDAERIYAGDPGVDEFAVSPDGRSIVFRSNGTGDPDDDARYNLSLLDIAAKRARPLTTRDGQERSAVWSPDGARIAFLAPRDPAITYSQEEVFVLPAPAATAARANARAGASKPAEPQRLTRDFAGAIEDLNWPKGNSIFFAAAVRTGNRLYTLDASTGAVTPASAEKSYVTDAHWNADGSSCIALTEGPHALPEVAMLHITSSAVEPQPLTDLNPQLKEFALGAQDVIRWKAEDGLEIEAILTKPVGWQAAEKYPLLLDVHGGPHNRRANTMTTGHFAQLFAAHGWLVLQPNFRGSSAYGHEFGIANRGDLGGKDADDILAGVDFVIAQGLADPERLAVMGESYGGYMTNWLIARTRRFRAAASLFGIFNFITDYSNSEISSWERDYLGKYYWEDLDLYLDRSPAKFAAQIETPVLILHGDADTNTFISNSQEMYRALRALGRTVRFLRFPREGHGFTEPHHVRTQYEEILAWLGEHALGRDAARPRTATEPARSGAWELRVAGVQSPENYAGIAPKGAFVEVELLIRALEPVRERFSLLLFNNSGSEVSLQALSSAGTAEAAGSIYPEGIVAETLGQRVLVKSQAQVAAMQPDTDGAHAALAVIVAFDAPAGARHFLLRVKDFPPVRIDLPVAAPSP
ncbi:MAG: S9 family peptidase [Candidatus Acidiferrales bacterium]